MDINDLSEDEQALLDQIVPPGTTLDQLGSGKPLGTGGDDDEDDDDDLLIGDEEDDEDKPPAGYVPKAEFDRISGKVDALTTMLAGRDAAAPPVVAQPTYVPPVAGPPPMSAADLAAQKEKLTAAFFEDPIGFANTIAQNAIAAERKNTHQRDTETQVTIARSEIARIRREAAEEYPEYKAALPAMDQLMKETDDVTLATLLRSGRLRDVYFENFKSKAFDVAHKVQKTAISRRRQAEPPELGGRGGSVSAIGDRGGARSSGKTIRVSELDEVDQIAVREFRKLGFTNAEIAKELGKKVG
jgi:tetrahydromethanopterin S-methyltransferase subunit G